MQFNNMKDKQEQGWRWGVLSLFLIILLLIATCSTMGQVGFNGNGFFENQSDSTDEWLHELEPFTLRVPGGAIAKYANPSPYRGGWGMDTAIIDTITNKYKSHEEDPNPDILAKWYRKCGGQPDYSYLDKLIEFSETHSINVIWVANIYINPELAILPIEYLLLNGVNIVVVEMGNESYSQVDHDFDYYEESMTGIRELVLALGIPVSHPAAPSGTRYRKDHNEWNNRLKGFISLTGDWVTFHPYYDRREFSGLTEPVDTVLALEQIDAFDFAGQFEDMKDGFNSGGFIVTEGNIQPSGLVGDTHVNAEFMKRFVSEGKKEFDYFCIHSGRSPDKYGLIYGVGIQKKNSTFEAFKSTKLDRPDRKRWVCTVWFLRWIFNCN